MEIRGKARILEYAREECHVHEDIKLRENIRILTEWHSSVIGRLDQDMPWAERKGLIKEVYECDYLSNQRLNDLFTPKAPVPDREERKPDTSGGLGIGFWIAVAVIAICILKGC